jgi:hypothetical protein
VPRPEWSKPVRKYKYSPHLNAPPSRRRPQVIEMVLRGCVRREIAVKLGLAKETVNNYIKKQVYKRHGVRGREALARKLGRPASASWETKREVIERALLCGRPYEQIAALAHARLGLISKYAWQMRRRGMAVPYAPQRRTSLRTAALGVMCATEPRGDEGISCNIPYNAKPCLRYTMAGGNV